ncbi:macro domain-containing protein [Patescibacteria group bacterium]|nr:macro domain-containing protein [Patescibacteria group bacterium]
MEGELLLTGERILRVKRGDITDEKVDAIVNAANSHLQHGGGVAGTIVRKGGRVIQEESNRIGYLPVGSVAVTTAGSLPARYVIHAIGPVWGEGGEDEKLKSAVFNSLRKAQELGLKSISIPAISSGIFGFPKKRCAEILIETIVEFFKENSDSTLKVVNCCNIDDLTTNLFLEEVRKYKRD